MSDEIKKEESLTQSVAPAFAGPGKDTTKPVFGKKIVGKAEGESLEENASTSKPSSEEKNQMGAEATADSEPKAKRASIDPSEHRLTPEQEKVYSGLLAHILKNGQWGYKGITDPTNKEISFQSEKVAERLYGYLYRHDPKLADKLWEENTGHTPSHKFHEKIKGQAITQTAAEALPELGGRVNSITSGIRKLRENELDDMQRQQLPQLMHMLGETDQRKIDYRRRAIQATFQKDQTHQDNGLQLCTLFGRGLVHGNEGVKNWRRENMRGKTIHQSIKDVQGNIKQVQSESVRSAVNDGRDPYATVEATNAPSIFVEMGKAFNGEMTPKEMTSASLASAPANMGAVGAAIAAKKAVEIVDRITGRESVKAATPTIEPKKDLGLQNARQQQMTQTQGQGPALSI